jgi:type VI secretion system secreted protein Hcp
MAFDAFLKIDGIPGESTDDKHKNWIEVLSYHHGLTQPVSSTASSAGGASAERVNFGAFSISKLVDKATPKLFEACCTGKHIKEITLEVCRSGDDKQKYLEIKMEQVLITSYSHAAKEDTKSEFPAETVSFMPGKFSVTYNQQGRGDGTLIGNIAAGWDLTSNKATL